MDSLLHVDASRPLGPIRPLHGVNNGPRTWVFWLDTTQAFRRAAIPLVRLHDTEYPYGGSHFVDIHCVFPVFDADPADPASYDFAPTDEYIRSIEASGAHAFYRLGESIEHFSKKYHIFPPRDYLHWARVCEGIIRHYTEGWADGFHYDMRYWEIWNEPDNDPDPAKSPMWQGTPQQFFELYATAANHLKRCFPQLKIGGYASCGFYSVTRETLDESVNFVNAPSRIAAFVAFFRDFLTYITDPAHPAPLDFFSWHVYSESAAEIEAHAAYARRVLDEFGLTDTESVLNEWNYAGENMFDSMKRMPGAAFAAATLCRLQNAGTVDAGMFYVADPTNLYCALFENLSTAETHTLDAFCAFGELYRLGTAVACAAPAGVTATAAVGPDGSLAVLTVNDTANAVTLTPDFAVDECLLLDETHRLTPVPFDGALTLAPRTLVLWRAG